MLSLNPGVFNQGKSLLGTWGGDSVPDRDYGRFGAPAWRPAASRCATCCRSPMRSTQADQALQDLAAGKIGRPLIDMSLR